MGRTCGSALSSQIGSKIWVLNKRADIQALRGIAILAVLFFHARLPFFSAGYLGVDVFFVVSGFLITSLIRNALYTNSFRLPDFYFRRAKRLLPAAYVTFFVTILAAPFFLTYPELQDFLQQVKGALTFTANLALKKQAGYFEGAAELKPFLHTWSLSIEEQYYLLLPAAMLAIPRRFWAVSVFSVLIASLAASLAFSYRGGEESFYLLTARAWELMMGSACAFLFLSRMANQASFFLFWPALTLLILLPFRTMRIIGFDAGALLICLSTAIIILRQHPALTKGRIVWGLGKIGDMYYSLYLIHWPVFAFFNNAWMGHTKENPVGMRLGLIGISSVLAYALHRWVEKPFHLAEIKNRRLFVGLLLLSSAGLLILAQKVSRVPDQHQKYLQIRKFNNGFSGNCDFKSEFQPLKACRNSDEPEMMVWGDSNAMHLVPGLVAASPHGPSLIQATKANCGPLLDVAMLDEIKLSQRWSENCIEFNDSVVSYLEQTPSIKTVVLSSRFGYYLGEEKELLKKDVTDQSYERTEVGREETLIGLKKSIDAVRALGKKTIVVGPLPAENFDVGRCVERMQTGLVIISPYNEDCHINSAQYRTIRKPTIDFLNAVPSHADVDVINLDSYLCDSESCQTTVDGVLIYGHGNHLSYEGSRYLIPRLSLLPTILEKAR